MSTVGEVGPGAAPSLSPREQRQGLPTPRHGPMTGAAPAGAYPGARQPR